MLLAWQSAGWISGERFRSTEFPFGQLADVAVDADGRIYVAEAFNSRIQRYSRSGAFELGWFVPAYGGAFRITDIGEGYIIVATLRGNQGLTYTASGQLQSASEREGVYYEKTSRPAGPYVVRQGLCPCVADRTTGQCFLLTPWPTRLTAAPFPVIAYQVLGVLFLAAHKRLMSGSLFPLWRAA